MEQRGIHILFLIGILHVCFYSFRKLLASKFQPTDARKAFPCFDEPQLKAIFKISIVHPKNTIAIANFPSVCFIH
jgi:aminopeptidase N